MGIMQRIAQALGWGTPPADALAANGVDRIREAEELADRIERDVRSLRQNIRLLREDWKHDDRYSE